MVALTRESIVGWRSCDVKAVTPTCMHPVEQGKYSVQTKRFNHRYFVVRGGTELWSWLRPAVFRKTWPTANFFLIAVYIAKQVCCIYHLDSLRILWNSEIISWKLQFCSWRCSLLLWTWFPLEQKQDLNLGECHILIFPTPNTVSSKKQEETVSFELFLVPKSRSRILSYVEPP